MSTIRLLPGQYVLMDDVQYKVVRRTGDNLIAMESVKTLTPITLTDQEVLKKISTGTLRLIEKSNLAPDFDPRFADFGSLKPLLKDAAIRRGQYLTRLAMETDTLSRPVVRRVIKQVAEEIGDENPPSYASVCRWWKPWNMAGRLDLRCLVPAFHLRGSKESKLPRESVELMKEVVEREWLSQPRKSAHTVTLLVRNTFNRLNDTRAPNHQLKVPSVRTIRRAIKELDKKTVMKMRYSKNDAAYEFHTFKKLPTVTRPLEQCELDETPLDLFIVDDKYRTPLGRPFLVTLVDRFSKMLLGYHLTFDAPSSDTAMACIRHAILDKSYIKEKYSHIVKNDMPVGGIPECIITDHLAGYKEKGFSDSLASLGIVHEFAAKDSKWQRANVEAFFRTVGVSLLHELPGTSYSNTDERAEYEAEKQAVFTLSEFDAVFNVYWHDYHSQAVNTGIYDIPIERWKEGCARNPVRPPDAIEDLDCLLGAAKEATLTREGIEMWGLRWNSSDLTDMRRRPNAPKKVTVRYDPNNIGYIRVLDPDTLTYVVVPSVDPEYATGTSYNQHKAIRRYAIARVKGRLSLDDLAEAKATIFRLADEARRRTKATRRVVGRRVAALDPRATNLDRPQSALPMQIDLESSVSVIDQINGMNAEEFEISVSSSPLNDGDATERRAHRVSRIKLTNQE